MSQSPGGAPAVGIESIGLHLPPLAMQVEELAALRGEDPEKYTVGLGCSQFAMCPPGFGVVDLAAEAARRALSRWEGDRSRIGMIAIGVIVVLRGLGRLPSRRVARVLAGLALFGGLTLFFHFHDGRIHFDAIYLQHAVMGATAVGVGLVLLAGARTALPRRWLTWAWPAFLTLMATVLLLYRET